MWGRHEAAPFGFEPAGHFQAQGVGQGVADDLRSYGQALRALSDRDGGGRQTDCVFVDDQSRNVLGAMKLGWQTVQFDVTNPADSYQRALKLLGL